MRDDRRWIGPPSAALALAVLLVACATPAGAAESPSKEVRAVELYEQGRYAEAQGLLEELAGKEGASGPLLYRLSYCRQIAGETQTAREMLERASARLEQELPAARDLEVPFYLVNAYQRLGRATDLDRVATATFARLERGEIARPDSALGFFRLGKMYADHGNEAQALDWYRKALAAFAREPSPNAAYVQIASKYVGQRDLARGDLPAAEATLSRLASTGAASIEEYDQLAVTRARIGRYGEAAEAWRKAELLDPASGDRPRYCARLARMAEALGQLPGTAPTGRAWTELTQQDLESLLKEQAQIVRDTIAEAASSAPLSEERHAALQTKVDAAKPLFVAAALEYALRGHGIREAAFFGGYAPLIFRSGDWEVPW